MLVVLALLVVGMIWLKLIKQPIDARIKEAQSRQDTAQTLILLEQTRAQKKTEMQTALDEIAANPDDAPTPICDYDHYLAVLDEIRDQLGLHEYDSVSGLETGTADDNGIYRRSVTVTNVRCDDYAEARELLDSFAAGPYRCMVKCVTIEAQDALSGSGTAYDDDMWFFERAYYGIGSDSDDDTAGIDENVGILLTLTITWYEKAPVD